MNVKLLHADDWVALYWDGHLIYQGHSIPEFEWHSLVLQHEPVEGEDYFSDQDSIAEAFGGHFPLTWQEFVDYRDDPYEEDRDYWESIESASDMLSFLRHHEPQGDELSVLHERVKCALEDFERELYKDV